MTLQPDAAGAALQAGVLLGHGGVFQAAIEIGIHARDAVEQHDDLSALSADGHGVPLAGGFAGSPRRRHDMVDRAGVLVEIELGMVGVEIVKNLDFYAVAADMALVRGADVDAAVA